MTTLQNATLTALGKVFIKGSLSATLKNATLTAQANGVYYANIYINDYLIGQGLIPYTHNDRYFYYNVTSELQIAIQNIPDWMLINFGYPPIS